MKTMPSPQMIIFTGVIIGVIGAAICGFGAYLASQQQAEFENELRAKNEEIVNLATGGDSWAYLSSGLKTMNGILDQPFGLSLNLVGNNPLNDLKIEVFEVTFSTGTETKSYTLNKIFSNHIVFLNKSIQPEPIAILTLPDKERVDYLVKLKARNGEIIQHLVFIKKKDSLWASATKVFKFKPSKDNGFSRIDLLEEVDADFPDKNLVWIEF